MIHAIDTCHGLRFAGGLDTPEPSRRQESDLRVGRYEVGIVYDAIRKTEVILCTLIIVFMSQLYWTSAVFEGIGGRAIENLLPRTQRHPGQRTRGTGTLDSNLSQKSGLTPRGDDRELTESFVERPDVLGGNGSQDVGYLGGGQF